MLKGTLADEIERLITQRHEAGDVARKIYATEIANLLDENRREVIAALRSSGAGAEMRDFETRIRAAFDLAEDQGALPLADDPVDAVMSLAAAARSARTDDRGNAFVLQHVLRTINSFKAAQARALPLDGGRS